MSFLEHDMGLSDFCEMAGVKTEKVADWRKRDMIIGYGRTSPDGKGRWRYSQEDAMKVHIAKTLSRSGFEWSVALSVAQSISEGLVDRAHARCVGTSGGNRFLVLFIEAGGLTHNVWTNDVSEAITTKSTLGREIPGPVAHVVDILDVQENLPDLFKNGLSSLVV